MSTLASGIHPETGNRIRLTEKSLQVRVVSEWDIPDYDAIISAAIDALTRPSDSAWYDEEMFTTHTLMFSTPDPKLTDDYMVDASNHETVGRDLSAEYPRAVDTGATFGHWTYSRFIAIKVRVIDSKGNIHPAFVDAYAIALKLRDDYPLWDDEDYSERQWQLWQSTVAEAISDAKRDDDEYPYRAHGAYADMVTEYLNENYGSGYWEEGWIDPDAFNTADEIARHRIESAQAVDAPINNSGETLEGM